MSMLAKTLKMFKIICQGVLLRQMTKILGHKAVLTSLYCAMTNFYHVKT